MPAPFVFKKVLLLVEAVGVRAATLDELLRSVSTVPAASIAYHMHREFIAHKFIRAAFPNDFADWVDRAIGDHVLAEQLAVLRVFRHRDVESLRAALSRLIATHLMAFPEAAGERAPVGLDFHFQAARSVVMECHKPAETLEQFGATLAELPASSLFYHLFETRFAPGTGGRDNDFVEWIATSLGDKELADKIANVDPYMFGLEELRRRLVTIVSDHRRARERRPS